MKAFLFAIIHHVRVSKTPLAIHEPENKPTTTALNITFHLTEQDNKYGLVTKDVLTGHLTEIFLPQHDSIWIYRVDTGNIVIHTCDLSNNDPDVLHSSLYEYSSNDDVLHPLVVKDHFTIPTDLNNRIWISEVPEGTLKAFFAEQRKHVYELQTTSNGRLTVITDFDPERVTKLSPRAKELHHLCVSKTNHN